MQTDDPPFLPVGTDVSAKYKGAFCEAKIKKVVKNIKCKVSFKTAGQGSTTVTDEAIKGTLRVGNTVDVRQDPKKDPQEAIITKIQDCSQYTVVFDDGDITTLRRSALCLKSGRHFAESETLDQLPLTHPEHFGNPVIGSSSRRGRRTNRSQSDDSDSEATDTITTSNVEREPHTGRVVLVQCGGSGGGGGGDKKRPQSSGAAQGWFPGLVVAPGAQDTVKIKVKEDYLVRSFKDGRYYTVPKKEAKEFKRSSANSEMGGLDAALQYLDKGVLPPHWDRDILFQESQSDEVDSEDSSDDEPREEKDHFVAQLYKFMDDRGTPLNRQPTIANKDIDLYRLFNVVQKLGGYNRVTNQNQWKGIAIRLGFQPATTSVTNLCKQAYKKFLHSFEEFYRKLGVTLVAHPRGGRSTGRSLIRDRDKIQNQSSSPAHSLKDEEKSSEKPVTPKAKEKEVEKEKEKEIIKVEKEPDVKEIKEKEVAKPAKEPEIKEKEVKGKEKEVKKEVKKEAPKETKVKPKREAKVKTEIVQSSEEEDSGDNQPLAPLSNKLEKSSSDATLSDKSSKVTETPVKKVYKNMTAEGTAGKRGLDRGEKASAKKVVQRRGSSARSGTKEVHSGKESRSKSASDSTQSKKQEIDSKTKDKESTLSIPSKKGSSSDKNDSDSSSRGSKSGKIPSRRNITPSDTPPSTPGSSSGSQQHNSKKPRKRKLMESSETPSQVISCDVGDKLKVYYGPAQSESKVTYEAKVIEVSGRGADTILRVHYTGWNTRYDEWIKPSRIADNLTQKNKHKDKGKRNQNAGPPESPGGKRVRQQTAPHSSSAAKNRTRNRSSSNNTTASNQQTTDVQSDSDSECESDSSGQRGIKRLTEEKPGKERGGNDTSSPVDKVLENEKEKMLRMGRVSRSPQVKRSADTPGSTLHSRVKRTRLKQEDRDLPRGRDFDLNEIRSELKGFGNAVKSPLTDAIKVEPETEPVKEDPPSIIIKQEKTPEKVTEDIYEFKEPEPFEFEARKSEEKKKRTTHRIFDDIPQLKLSPTHVNVKSPIATVEAEKSPPQPAKSHFDSVFDKLCESESFNVDSNNSSSAGKESEALSIFSEDIANEDSGDRLLISETEDSQGPLFTYQQDIFPEKSFLPIFKGFQPAKNQETYSKKDAANKMRDIDDDLTSSSALKGEQSSDEDPIGTAIKRVNEHSMSDDSNDSELLKTPATPATSTVTTVNPSSEIKPSLDTKPKSAIADSKPKPSIVETKTKTGLVDVKIKPTVTEIKTNKTPLVTEVKTKLSVPEIKTRSPLLDIKTKATLLEQKTKPPLVDVKPKQSVIDIKAKASTIDIKAKPQLVDIKSKSPLLEGKTKAILIDTKAKTIPIDIIKTVQEKVVNKPTTVDNDKSIAKVDEEVTEKSIAPVENVTEAVKTKPDIQQSTNVVLKQVVLESNKRDGSSKEPEESKAPISIDSNTQPDAKSESDVVGSFADIVIPEPPPFLTVKEGTSIADKVLQAIKRAATPTPKDSKIPKLDVGAKLTKVTTSGKVQASKIIASASASDTSKTPVIESIDNSSNVQSADKEIKENVKVIKLIDNSLGSSKDKDLTTCEIFPKAESSLNLTESLLVKKETIERRKSGAEQTSLGGKSNKVLNKTIQKLSSQISQPTPPLPEFKDERSEDSDSSESDRRLIIDKLSEEESQSGISDGAASQPPKMQTEKSRTNWSETSLQKDLDSEKQSNLDSLGSKDGVSSSNKVPEEECNISLLLCEETIPGSPAPENLVDGVKSTVTKQKSRNLEIPFASAPSISPDQSKDPLSLKEMSRDNGRDGIGSGRNDRERERDRDTECLGGTGANTVDAVMDNTPPDTPDSSLDNMSPSRDQLLSDGDNQNEMSNKPAEEDNRASAISKKLGDVEKSNSGSNLRGSAPGSPIVGTGRRGRRPRSLRASEGEDHHQSVNNTSIITGAHASPQYNTSNPRPLRYNFYVELDEGMDAASRIALLTSRLADLRKAYHSVKAELATIDRRRKKLRRKEREAVKAAKAACAT